MPNVNQKSVPFPCPNVSKNDEEPLVASFPIPSLLPCCGSGGRNCTHSGKVCMRGPDLIGARRPWHPQPRSSKHSSKQDSQRRMTVTYTKITPNWPCPKQAPPRKLHARNALDAWKGSRAANPEPGAAPHARTGSVHPQQLKCHHEPSSQTHFLWGPAGRKLPSEKTDFGVKILVDSSYIVSQGRHVFSPRGR